MREHEDTSGVVHLFFILVLVMVLQVYTYVKFIKLYSLNMCIMYINYTSIKLFKK